MAYEWNKSNEYFDYGQNSRSATEKDNSKIMETFIPLGFEFCPNDEELISYLKCKLKGILLPQFKHIEEVDIYTYSPMELSDKYQLNRESEDELYFFTPRSKKYPKGHRPDRFAKDGFWKPTASEKPIFQHDNGEHIGNARTLNYYRKNHNNKCEKKTQWLMREYAISKHATTGSRIEKTFDKWVVVKIYKKRGTSNSADDENMKDENGIHGDEQPIIDAPESHLPLAHGAPIYPLFNGAPQYQNNQTHLPTPQHQQFTSQPVEEKPHPSSFSTPIPLQVIQPVDLSCYGSSSVSFNSQQTQQEILPEISGVMNGFETIAPYGYGVGYSSAADQNGLNMDQL